MIDSSVIASVKSRKDGAFKLMYENCIGYVYSIVRRYVRNESDHKDVIQEIFARLFLSIDTFDQEKGDFKFWLRRLVINQCMQQYRQGKSPALVVPIEQTPEKGAKMDNRLEELTKADIENLLRNMPLGYRQVFMLVIIDEYSHKEAGELLDITPETSRSQLSRAKTWLQKNISKKNLKLFINGL